MQNVDILGKKLAEYRKVKNLSQKDLAEAFVTSRTTIGKTAALSNIPTLSSCRNIPVERSML